MSETMQQIVIDTARRIFRDHCDPDVVARASKGEWPSELWASLEDNGFTRVGEDGLTWPDALATLPLVGYYSLPGPLAESFVASRLLEKVSLPIPTGVVTMAIPSDAAVKVEQDSNGLRITGRLDGVPWARNANGVVVVFPIDGEWAVTGMDLKPHQLELGLHDNLAAEPRDTLTLVDEKVAEYRLLSPQYSRDHIVADLALTRVMMAVGALERLLDYTLEYANQRTQFGRAIGRFQAVQQEIAEMAGEVAAVRAIANLAMMAQDASLQTSEPVDASSFANAVLTTALGKIRLGQAVQVSTTVAHQVHGAMGFTEEYPLHHASRRLWSWRHEYGNEMKWSSVVAEAIRGEDLWSLIAR